jgi:purine-binding chemotaxis protein CheW
MNNDGIETMNVAVSSDDDEMKGKYLTFWTDDQLFGVPIKDVVQIVGMQKITKIPEYPDYAKGVINLRGTIVPLIDVRLRMGKPGQEYNDRTCIIVTNVHSNYFGFIVDQVEEVTDISDDVVSPPPKLNGDTVNKYLTGIARMGDKLVLMVNTAKILGEEEFAALLESAQ